MNFAQANAVPLRDILSAIGIDPSKERGNDLFYLAPWRKERTASLHVNVPKNVWYDHGEGVGGSASALVRAYLERAGHSSGDSDVLRWFSNMTGYVPMVPPTPRQAEKTEPVLALKKLLPISHVALIRYLESRGIPLDVAKQLLQEARVYNRTTQKNFFALALKNEDDGYELRNPYFKGSISPKTITFIRGREVKPDAVHTFEGSMDYLSVVARQDGKPLKGDAIILNSLSCLKDGIAYIKNYGYRMAYSWFDNDAAGHKASQVFDAFVKTEAELAHLPMNSIYAPHKDVNEWHVATPLP